MFFNYIKIAWRNILRKKMFAFINVIGLAVGISTCFVMLLMIDFENGFDRAHVAGDRIYRIYSSFSGAFTGTNRGTVTGAGPYIRDNFTQVEKVTQFFDMGGNKVTIGKPDAEPVIFRDGIKAVVTDSSFFDMFSAYQWIAGDPKTSLDGINQVVLTETTFRKYFGNEVSFADQLGTTITYRDSIATTLTGVVKDIPFRTDFKFTDFISVATAEKFMVRLNDWRGTNSGHQTFIQLKPGTTPSDMTPMLAGLQAKYKETHAENEFQIEYLLQPLSDLHFNPELGIFNSAGDVANKSTLKIFALVALLILSIAAINYINLETAQATRRAKEIGIRKVLGSSRANLVLQFLSESLLLTLVAAALALPLSQFALLFFDDFVSPDMSLNLTDPATIGYLAGLVLAVGLAAGVYPAFVLSKFLPVKALKSQIYTEKGKSISVILRKTLTIFQFTFSQILIACCLLMIWQINFLSDKELGFKKDEIVVVSTPWRESETKKERLLNELSSLPEISAISVHDDPPSSDGWSSDIFKSYNKEGNELIHDVHMKRGRVDYLSFYEIEMIAGRLYLPNDSLKEVVINEKFASDMGCQTPQDAVNQQVSRGDKKYTIVGVVKNFHNRSLHSEIDPMVIVYKEDGGDIALKLDAGGLAEADAVVDKIKAVWEGVYPDHPIRYQFLDELVNNFYESERRTVKLASTATIIAIIISCLGLFGLVSFSTIQRTKEIGIRKVLGASVGSIVTLMSRDFLTLVVIASLVAAPVAYWLGMKWLEDFAYSIEPGVLLFLLTGIVALLIAFSTVAQQAFKAATENPVNALRNE
ncbi:FtsX-like permease family protein [uncultured Imperialibacter sp.]|uniref:FtsX-like permease family protein n=1 Tax=uncultured Imperialibacter sp. TaxID=1672639 RepID=UPI0030D90526|tara:strand:- start:14192 stop:16627 length:2436 start_codon:yes stop_codon:yes gene_type:complete